MTGNGESAHHAVSGGDPAPPPRDRSDEERARLRFLADAGRILESSLDYETTLKELGQLIVPELADWYTVDLVDYLGRLTNLAVAHVDPTKVELAQQLGEQHPPDPSDGTGVVEVARLFAAQRRATERMELASRVTSLLSESLEYEAGLQRLADVVVTEGLADFCVLDVIDEDGSVRRLAVIHKDPAKQPIMDGLRERVPALDSPVPAAVAMRTMTIVKQDVQEDVLASIAADDEHLRLMRQIGGINFLAIPLIARGRVLGALTISSTTRAYDDEDLALAKEIAGGAALALDNARLFEAQARAARQAARLQSILDAVYTSDSLADLLQELLYRVRREIGTDAAAILLMDEHEPVLRMRAAVGLGQEVLASVRVPLGQGFAGRIAATRQPLVVEDVQSFGVVSSYLRERGRSIVGVPLLIDREVVGVLHTSSWTPRRFDADDISLLQLAAERAAVSIRRNELFERQREIATLLQDSLLPSEIPTIPGVEVATLFIAAGRGVEVGGDFYDVFAIDDRTWGVAVGDVCGRGPQAAALTALARNGLRTLAYREKEPGEVLASLNETMIRSGVDRFCTCIYGTVGLLERRLLVTLARGGHVPAHVIRATGRVEVISPNGPLVGVFPDVTFESARICLDPGDGLVLFTDGLVERNPALGDERGLARVLAACASLDARSITSRLAETLEGATDPARDDVVVLVLRVPSEPPVPE